MQSLHRNLLIAIVLLLPAQLIGEEFYAIGNVVDTRFEGGLGSIVGFASRVSGHSLRNVITLTYLQGHKMRIDHEVIGNGTIYDLDAERMITLDEKQKTYSSVTFAEMSAAYEQARSRAEQSRAKEEAKASKKDEVKMKYHVKVERPGEHKNIAITVQGGYGESGVTTNYDAERVILTITLEAEATPEGGKAEQVGSMVLLLDQWIVKDPPHGRALTEFYRLFSQKLGREFRSQVQGMQALFASDPRLKDGFEAAGKELQKVKGISLRSTTYAVLVPANTAFDRQLVLDEATVSAAASAKSDEAERNEKPKSKVGGFFSALKTAAEGVGKRMENANQERNAPPKQTTLLVIDDQMTGVRTYTTPDENLTASFTVPAGYTEVKAKGM